MSEQLNRSGKKMSGKKTISIAIVVVVAPAVLIAVLMWFSVITLSMLSLVFSFFLLYNIVVLAVVAILGHRTAKNGTTWFIFGITLTISALLFSVTILDDVKVTENFDDQNAKLDDLSKKFDDQNAKLDDLSKKFDDLSKKLDDLPNK